MSSADKAIRAAKMVAKRAVGGLLGGAPIDRTQTGWSMKDVAHPHNEMGPGDWQQVSHATKTGEGVQEVDLPIRSMYATQSTVNPDFGSVKPAAPGNYPFVIKKNGKHYVQDGHHRIVSQAAKGAQTARVRMFNLDDDTQTQFPLIDRSRGGRTKRAGGGSLSDAMNSFSQAREAQFNRPASGNSDAALLAALQSQHPQLAVAEAPEQRREATSQGVGDLGAEIDEGAKWLSGTQDTDPTPVKGKPQGISGALNSPTPQSQPSHPGGPSHSNIDQNSAAMHMMDRLVTQHGWTPAAAAIAAGNAMQESGFQPSVAGDASIPGGSHGYAQWNRDRFANLQGFAKQQGTDWTNPDTQIDFLANEAKSRVPEWSSQSDLSQARPISKAYEGYAVEGNRVPDASKFYDMYQSRPQPQQAQGAVPPPAQPQDTTGGPLSEADPMTNVDQAKRGGLMRRDHFDDGGSAGDSAATAAGVAAGFGGVGDANGAPAGVSTNSGVTGFAGVGEGDTGFGSVGYNSPGVNNSGSGGGNTGFGGASSGSGGGANSSGVGVGANSAGAGAAAGNGSGGGGGTAAGGSSNGHGGPGVSGTQNGGNIGVTAQDIYAMLVAAGKQSQINFGGPGGPGSVQSLGVPPGVLSGVNTATTPVSVSSLGPPGYSASQVAAINAMMAARGGVGLGGGASPGFGNNGFGGGSSSATVGGFGGNSNSSGAEGVSTAGIGGLGGGPAAVTAPSMEAQLGPAQQAMLAQMRSGVASPSGPPGSAPANAPSVNATNMMGVQGFNVAGPRAAAPAQSAAPQASGATSGRNPQAQNAVEHQNRGGYLQRADGGSVAHIPTNELIEMALGRIRQRRNAADGGSQDLGLSFAALAPRSPGGNQAQYAYNLGLGGLGPAGDINPGSAQGQALQSGQAPAAAAAPAPPNTPAIPSGTVGNHGGYGAVGASGSPISGVPNASPIGGGYNNTLDQVLGTNNPSMDQIFGFTYPTPPAPKPQPQGPVSQDTINQLSLMGNGAQQFAAGGAIIMDAALNKARKAVKAKSGEGRA